MKKTFEMRLDPTKETKGTHRYERESGDEGVTTLYVRKASIDGPPPRSVIVTVEG